MSSYSAVTSNRFISCLQLVLTPSKSMPENKFYNCVVFRKFCFNSVILEYEKKTKTINPVGEEEF